MTLATMPTLLEGLATVFPSLPQVTGFGNLPDVSTTQAPQLLLYSKAAEMAPYIGVDYKAGMEALAKFARAHFCDTDESHRKLTGSLLGEICGTCSFHWVCGGEAAWVHTHGPTLRDRNRAQLIANLVGRGVPAPTARGTLSLAEVRAGLIQFLNLVNRTYGALAERANQQFVLSENEGSLPLPYEWLTLPPLAINHNYQLEDLIPPERLLTAASKK